MTCARCGGQVGEGQRCPHCGAVPAVWRSFAAHRGERLAHVNALSTLLPHLHHDRVHDFRWAFVAGLVLVTGFYLAGLIVAALLLAALLVPLLYLVYLYEAHLSRQEPVRFSVLALGGGAVLGGAMALIVNQIQGVRALELTESTGILLGLTILVPTVQELIKPVPALMLRARRGFEHTVDGLTLGVASGFGFALAQTLVNFVDVINNLPFRVDPSAWIYPLITAAVLLPLLQATCAGAVTVAIWNARRRDRRHLVVGIPVALLGHIAFALGSQLLSQRGPGHVAVIVWQAAVVAAMIVFIRWVLHQALTLDSSAELRS